MPTESNGKERIRKPLQKGIPVASRDLQRIRNAILDRRYTLTEHAYEEMDEDELDVLDVESAILTGLMITVYEIL